MWWSRTPEGLCGFCFAVIAQSVNSTPDPCIMPGMELAWTKIPYLPPDWTTSRGAMYLVKLAMFVLVPGLHQITCGRRILGWLLMATYVVAEFCTDNVPVDFTSEYVGYQSDLSSIAPVTVKIAIAFSWFLLIFDLKNILDRKISLKLISSAVIIFCFYYSSSNPPRIITFFVAQENNVCPAFCKYDVVQYDMRDYEKNETAAVGDIIVVFTFDAPPYLGKILASPEEPRCEDGRLPALFAQGKNPLCQIDPDPGNDEFIVVGGPDPGYKTADGTDVTLIPKTYVWGVRPEKIGNTHKHFILSDAITDIAGIAMLTVYKWTGTSLPGVISPSKTMIKTN
jgi:hypothetical protein